MRTALGAAPGQLVSMVLGQAMRLVVTGVVLGLLIALATGGYIAPLLFNVSSRDPFVLGLVTLTLTLVGVSAAAIPAWRATRVDPNVAFRVE